MTKEARIDNGEKTVFKKWCWENWTASGRRMIAQLVKNPPATWEIWVRSLGWEDPQKRERLPTPVFWPGEFHGLYNLWDCKELDTTERLSFTHSLNITYKNGLKTYIDQKP